MMSLMVRLSGTAQDLLRQAEALAKARGHAVVGTEHLLLAMTQQSADSFSRRVLDQAGVTEDLRRRIEALIGE